MQSVRDNANSVFHEDQKFFKSDTFESDTIFVTFEIFGKCSESVTFNANNNLQEDLKILFATNQLHKHLDSFNCFRFYQDNRRVY